ncbi:hypothetical protein BH23GEM10_BH23GEM10_11770 [soil metagenome]
MRAGWRQGRTWRVVRVVWVSAGVAFMIYLVLSFSAWGVDDDVMRSAGDIVVSETATSITFAARGGDQRAGLIFMPGGMVEPEAYAPGGQRWVVAGDAN